MGSAKSFCLDLRSAHDHFPGIGRYGFNLARAAATLLDGAEHLTLLRDPTQPSSWRIEALAGDAVEVVDVPVSVFALQQQWRLPVALRRLGVGMYHAPCHLMPALPGVPAVVTFHDLIPLVCPRHFSRARRAGFALAARAALRAARRVIAVSQTTARDLRHLLSVRAEDITVIPEAADPSFRPQSRDEVRARLQRLGLPEGYVLCVGTNRPHKNLPRLIDAWAALAPQPMPLVIAGPWNPRHAEAKQLAATLPPSSVCFLGRVAAADLPALYAGARLVVVPSEYEGFGLPVLEAMACGAPVACAGTGSLPEVAGDAAVTFDPFDAGGIAETIRTLLEDVDLRAELARRGIDRAQQFSWEETARRTLEVYREVAG